MRFTSATLMLMLQMNGVGKKTASGVKYTKRTYETPSGLKKSIKRRVRGRYNTFVSFSHFSFYFFLFYFKLLYILFTPFLFYNSSSSILVWLKIYEVASGLVTTGDARMRGASGICGGRRRRSARERHCQVVILERDACGRSCGKQGGI